MTCPAGVLDWEPGISKLAQTAATDEEDEMVGSDSEVTKNVGSNRWYRWQQLVVLVRNAQGTDVGGGESIFMVAEVANRIK